MCIDLLNQIEDYKLNRHRYTAEERLVIMRSFREDLAAVVPIKKEAQGEDGQELIPAF
jgi:hypothetical protein